MFTRVSRNRADAHTLSGPGRAASCHLLIASAALITGLVSTVFAPAAGAAERGVPYRASAGAAARRRRSTPQASRRAEPPPALPARTNPARAIYRPPQAPTGARPRRPPCFLAEDRAELGAELRRPDDQRCARLPSGHHGGRRALAVHRRDQRAVSQLQQGNGGRGRGLERRSGRLLRLGHDSAAASNFTSDPHIRYDRLSQRWIIVMIDVPGGRSATRRTGSWSRSPTVRRSRARPSGRCQLLEDAGGTDNLFADYPTSASTRTRSTSG